ncbi:DNA polymerase III subunit chi [Sphingomonas bacterium]|uniref:DNA polymerase III subunit chi n=1 Tax=Sphingomonas bacterium TaxID=1895847 RepID=UPI001576DA96|nr:DNA polymerase III subunit chi [Sphingomonas bacterium]
MQVDFYHLTATAVERALPRIAERVVAGGGRLLVVAADPEQRAALDRQLWVYAADSFLPHAQAGGDADADQPVLIAAAGEPANNARFVALVDGVWREEALAFERAFHFFGDDVVEAARAAWRALSDRKDVERRYWKQDDDGRWSQAA